ncbi:heterokaryon incompatibility protein 6, OR allele [Diplogelasinospora grovesii]|uniref:Heterokaryon incompatibility protein 6, OR allele n=1 Tax=Diplogelasinospora grovesii TaxID=303347 RepID=A0AAN6S5E5_9PEZI|nr:heterokaryon incompatibility protein 6, OR allele [Diplogelasinospora grovesii]
MSRHFVIDIALGSIVEGIWPKSYNSTVIRGPQTPETDQNLTPDREDNEKVAAAFHYSPLYDSPESQNEKRPVRLLHLLPGSRQEDIECRLVKTDISQAANSYEALSYVWGDASALTPIQVNGDTLRIGKNLRSALLNLRLTDTPRTLWVDAVCIDEENVDERDRQVANMGDIYRSASRTIVWLGDATKESAEAFAMIKSLGDEAIELKESPGVAIRPGNGPTFQKFKNDAFFEKAIMARAWWRRVWTAQELLLAKNAIIVNGRFQVDWDFFCAAAYHGAALEIWNALYFGNTVESEIEGFYAIQAMKNLPKLETLADELLAFLIHARQRNATDPRDKIFAVLGLVSGSPQNIGIKPDYRSSVGEVYCEATRRLIASSGNIDVLGVCFPFKAQKISDLPSWVADWSSTDNIARPLMNDAKGTRRATHASRKATAKPRWDADGKTLIIEGHAVDTVTRLSSVQHEIDESAWDMDDISFDDDDDQTLSEILRDLRTMAGRFYENLTSVVPHLATFVEWERFAMGLKPTNPDPKTAEPMAIFCQTLCAGTLAPGGFGETESLFRTWMDSLAPIRNLKQWKVDRAKRIFRPLGFLGYLKSTWQTYGEFPAYITHTTERRLGGTEKGYLCLLPKATEVGDQLTILKGGRVPVILRPRGDGTMEFIGEAYVHGIMDGEAFREDNCSDIQIR